MTEEWSIQIANFFTPGAGVPVFCRGQYSHKMKMHSFF